MQKVSYVADGQTTTFFFNFPYFDQNNVVVTVNNGTAPSYNLIGTRGGMDPDFPFVAGKIVFQRPPQHFDVVTIERRLPLVRPVDFQPLAQITPTMLNQDMNYTIELLKDVHDDLDTFQQNYADIVDKESTTLLLEKIDLVNQNIADLAEDLSVLDNIPEMQNAIESLQSTVETMAGDLSDYSDAIDLLNTRTNGMVDCLIESQAPSADNNYTWYRKYKSGWVEQGGVIAVGGDNVSVVFPLEMANTNYQILGGVADRSAAQGWRYANKTTTGFTKNIIGNVDCGGSYEVRGMGATA